MVGVRDSFGNKDSILGTVTVAVVLCLVCSVLVAGAAVALRPIKERNERLNRQRNVLVAAGVLEPSPQVRDDLEAELNITAAAEMSQQQVDEFFKQRVRPILVDLDSGEAYPADAETEDRFGSRRPETISDLDEDVGEAASDTEDALEIPSDKDIAGIGTREKYAIVYEILDKDGRNVERRVFPIRGKGLWSTMRGYVGVRQEDDPNELTIIGLKFYEQKETPGLGGEVDNDVWRKKWIGKQIYDLDKTAEGEGYSGYVVGAMTSKTATQNEAFAVDAIAGATVTSVGVTNTFRFWFGPLGFGKYLWKNAGVTDPAARNQPDVIESTDPDKPADPAAADPADVPGDDAGKGEDENFDGGDLDLPPGTTPPVDADDT